MKPFERVSTEMPGVVHHPSRPETPPSVQSDGALSYWVLGALPLLAVVILILRSVPRRIRATVTPSPQDPQPSSLTPPPAHEADADVDELEREIHAFYETEDGQKH